MEERDEVAFITCEAVGKAVQGLGPCMYAEGEEDACAAACIIWTAWNC